MLARGPSSVRQKQGVVRDVCLGAKRASWSADAGVVTGLMGRRPGDVVER